MPSCNFWSKPANLNQRKLFRFRNMRYAIVLAAILGVSHGMQQCTDSSDCGIAPTECDISPGINCLMCCEEGEARRIYFLVHYIKA